MEFKKVFLLLISILSFLSTNLFSQDSTLVQTYYAESGNLNEEFYVLKKDQQIKHGLYISFYDSDQQQIYEIGEYKLDKRNNYWQEYSDDNIVVSSGMYLNGEKTGIWNATFENGQVTKKYDYDTQKELPIEIYLDEIIFKDLMMAKYNGLLKYRVEFDEACKVSTVNLIEGIKDKEFKNKLASALSKKYELFNKYNVENNDCQSGYLEETFDISKLY